MPKFASFNPFGAEIDYSELSSAAQASLNVPIGTILAWHKDFANTPALPDGFVECDGSVLSDADSVYNGQTIPDLNGGNRFLRGDATSGDTGGSASIAFGFSGDVQMGGADAGCTSVGGSSSSHSESILPPHFEVVWIMRVK